LVIKMILKNPINHLNATNPIQKEFS
jgi:hypothetical protein